MKPVKYFLIFGICVAATVLLAQSALGATRAAAAKPAARVSTFEPARHSAKATTPARLRVQISALGRMRASGFSAAELRR
jgi:hypothetical protein